MLNIRHSRDHFPLTSLAFNLRRQPKIGKSPHRARWEKKFREETYAPSACQDANEVYFLSMDALPEPSNCSWTETVQKKTSTRRNAKTKNLKNKTTLHTFLFSLRLRLFLRLLKHHNSHNVCANHVEPIISFGRWVMCVLGSLHPFESKDHGT